jgi:hypothetical protein
MQELYVQQYIVQCCGKDTGDYDHLEKFYTINPKKEHGILPLINDQ